MVAATKDKSDTFLKFKNICGHLKLQLYGEGVTVKSIALTGKNNEKIAGTATITPSYSGAPTIRMAEDATETITLDCDEGVKIGTTAETATAFWIAVPPTTFDEGFEVTITDINGVTFTKSTSRKISIERNVIKPMEAFEAEVIPYLTFYADAEQSFKLSRAIETLEYSLNGGAWTELGKNTVFFGGDKGELRIRGRSSMGTAEKIFSIAM